MLSKSFNAQNTVAGGAIIIALFSVISRILGLFRDRLLSGNFGAGNVLDAYYASFRLPDLVFQILVFGALSSAFIPVFLEHFSKDKTRAWGITNLVLNSLFLIIFIFSIIFFIFAPLLVDIMVPGFDESTKSLTVSLTRIMLLGSLFFTLSNVVSSVLTALRRFLVYSLAPVMYNIGIIFGILFLTKTNLGILGLAWGVVLGAFLHLLIQIPMFFKLGFKWSYKFNIFDPVVKKILKLMLPRCFGLAVSQLNFIVITFIASTIAVGSVAVYSLAFNLISVPVGIFGISLAVSLFPLLSKRVIDKEYGLIAHQFSRTIRYIAYLIIPVSVLFILLRTQIVRIILGTGIFSWKDTVLTAQTLGWFSFSLFAQTLIPVFARSFYAYQDTVTPVKIALISFTINIVGCILLAPIMGVYGLALAFSLSSIINISLLYIAFNKKNKLNTAEIFNSFFKIIGLSALMVVVVQVVKYQIGDMVNMHTFLGVFIQLVVSGLAGILFYVLMSFVFKFKEIKIFLYFLKKR
ncbi:murein biosynthesis integral membrane protein MurJ [Patescibacteria group bacterium]|nr:murein biosynthesis integral membrane protein MurJ [Patescibacteria group bacterium]